MQHKVEHVIERLGLRFEADGLPRVASRVLGFLLVTPEALSLEEIGEALRVSKTSVSTSCRLLERQGVAERVTHPGDRRDYYRIADDLPVRHLDARVRQLEALRALLKEAADDPAIGDPEVETRLRHFASFFGHLGRTIGRAGEAWLQRDETMVPSRGNGGGGREEG